MSSAPSLSPMYSFPGWIVDDININWKASEAIVSLRKDGRIKKIKCSQCNHAMTVARKKERFVQDVPLGELKVILTFTACQMYCSRCHRFETKTPPGSPCVRILVASKILIRGMKNEKIIYPSV